MSNRKKIIITGASGFLGRHLVERLKDNVRYRVFALSSKPDELKEKIGGSNVDYLYKNAIEEERAAEMLNGAIVVSCAYPRNSTGMDIADGLKYIQRVFETAADQGALAIINISSQSVYSQQRTESATEDTPVSLESSYAVGKYAVELMLESICKGSQTAYTSLRMASLIGPGFDQRIVNRFVIKIMHHEPITIVRQDKQLGFMDVEDAVSAILAISDYSEKSWNSVYTVGNGKGYTIEEIYDAVASILKKRIEVSDPVMEKGSDIHSTAVSFERLHADTGFVPEIELNESIEKIIAQM